MDIDEVTQFHVSLEDSIFLARLSPDDKDHSHVPSPKNASRNMRNACNECAKLKIKCSGGPPTCHSCKERQTSCTFSKKRKSGRKPKDTKLYPLLQEFYHCEREKHPRSQQLNEDHITECLQIAAAFLDHSGRKLLTQKEFVRSMTSFQEEDEAYAWGLNQDDLEKLFWLTGVEKEIIDPYSPKTRRKPFLTKKDLGLLFLWLGSAQLENVVLAPVAVQYIHNYVEVQGLRDCYEGFCSREAANFILRARVNDGEKNPCVTRLIEGRKQLKGNRVVLYCRNMATSRFGYDCTADDLSTDRIEHVTLLKPCLSVRGYRYIRQASAECVE